MSRSLKFSDELTHRLSTNSADFFVRQLTIRPADHFALVPTTKVIQLVPLEDGLRSTGRFQVRCCCCCGKRRCLLCLLAILCVCVCVSV